MNSSLILSPFALASFWLERKSVFSISSSSCPLPFLLENGARTCTEPCCTFLGREVCLSQEAYKWSLFKQVPYHLPFQPPKEKPRQTLWLLYFFSMPVLLSLQRNFSFHEINTAYIKFYFSETEIWDQVKVSSFPWTWTCVPLIV